MTDTPAKNRTSPDAAAADTVAQPGQSENLVRALEQFMSTIIGDQLTAMLDSADEILFEMAEKAGNGNEQRLYFDALRVIRIERARLLRTFQDNLQQAFAAGRNERSAAGIDLDDMDNWSIQGSEETEEIVAAANLESKASALYQKELFELENRLETLSSRSAQEVSPKLIAPARIFDAFRHTVKGLEVEFPIKQVIYRLAERSLLGNLGQVYTGANQMLEARGYEPSRYRPPSSRAEATPSTPAAAPAPADAMGAAGASAGGSAYAPPGGGGGGAGASSTAWPSGLSASRLMEGLATAGKPGGAVQSYTDSHLAQDIGAALDAMSQGRPYSGWIPPSNVALTGQMFDTLYQDRQLPEAARPLLRRLQYPVMKTALADSSFFSNPQHPVRKLVHDIHGMLASADSASEQEIGRLADLIEHLLRQFEVAPERLNRSAERAPAVSEEQADQFLAEQKERQAAHRAQILEKVRRLVAQELKLRTSAHRVPETVMPLLLSGFGPLLAVNVLRGGMRGIPWKESIALLERVLASIEPGLLPHEHQSAEEAEIVTSITERLIGIGLPHEKVQKLVAALLEIYQKQALEQAVHPVVGLNTAVPPPPPPVSPEVQAAAAAQQALSVILTTGSWFQVWDAPNNQRRWLKLHAYMPARDAIVFDDFTGENHLRIQASTLIRDLIAGRSAPVDPNPAVQRSLTLLSPLAAMLPASDATTVWQPAAAGA